MQKDVFISYQNQDKAFADALCAELERQGVSCWIAPRDIIAGESWRATIVSAIKSTRIMALVFSSNTHASEQVKRELSLADSNKAELVPIFLEDIEPQDDFAFHLTGRHWIKAIGGSKSAVREAAQQIILYLTKHDIEYDENKLRRTNIKNSTSFASPPEHKPSQPKTDIKKLVIPIGVGCILLVVAFFIFRNDTEGPNPTNTPSQIVEHQAKPERTPIAVTPGTSVKDKETSANDGATSSVHESDAAATQQTPPLHTGQPRIEDKTGGSDSSLNTKRQDREPTTQVAAQSTPDPLSTSQPLTESIPAAPSEPISPGRTAPQSLPTSSPEPLKIDIAAPVDTSPKVPAQTPSPSLPADTNQEPKGLGTVAKAPEKNISNAQPPPHSPPEASNVASKEASAPAATSTPSKPKPHIPHIEGCTKLFMLDSTAFDAKRDPNFKAFKALFLDQLKGRGYCPSPTPCEGLPVLHLAFPATGAALTPVARDINGLYKTIARLLVGVHLPDQAIRSSGVEITAEGIAGDKNQASREAIGELAKAVSEKACEAF